MALLKEGTGDERTSSDFVNITVSGHGPSIVLFPAQCHAEISAYDSGVELTISAAGIANKVQITTFDTNGASYGMTPDHTNDHITVDKAGKYLCTLSLSAESAGGGAAEYGFSIWKNNGATLFENCHTHRKLAGGTGDVGSLSISGIIDLAVSDTIELWVYNEDGTQNIVIDDVTLSLTILL